MSIIGHLNSSSDSEGVKPTTEKIASTVSEISIPDFFDLAKPWVLVKEGSFLGYFDFVPRKLRVGPWHPISIVSILFILYGLSMEAIKLYPHGLIPYFENDIIYNYDAFSRQWFLTAACCLWMIFVCWHILAYSAKGAAAWSTFTVWSWTLVTVRHGLCTLVPIVPAMRLPMEMLRFPALLSATVTFFIWNFVLFPVILMFIKDAEKRSKFLGYMTNFRLTQLHVFNIFFAGYNGVFLGPPRKLHLGDLGAAGVLLIAYMAWYYCILDRIGVHLYPIFSPRTPFVIFSYALLFGVCYASFEGWQVVLSWRDD